jgi:hypothetical protein
MDAQGGFAYCLSLSIVIIASLATVGRQQSCEEQPKSEFFFFFGFTWIFCRASSPSFLSTKSQFISGRQTCAYLNRD